MALTYTRKRLSSTAREALYDRCRGDKEFPDCNICGLPVDGVRQAWHESHDPDGPPHCFGGTETGIAHAECNLRHGAEVVVPMDAKATRIRQNFIGASVSRFPMRGGRNDSIKRKVGGGVVPRQSRVPKVSFDPPASANDTGLDAQLAAVSAETACPSKPERSRVQS
jgi:hypothetical protein